MTVISDRPFNALNESGFSDIFTGNMSFVSDASAPHSPSGVLRATFPAGFGGGTGVGSSYITFNRRTLYVSYWAKLSANFYGHPSGVNKQAYFFTPAFDGLFYFNIRGQGAGSLSPEVDFQSTVSEGTTNFAPNLIPGAVIPRDQWYLIEVVAVGNTAGNADGSIDVYLNGAHTHHKAMQWQSGASTWGYFYYYNDWGGVGQTVPETMTLDWDHVYLSGKN